MRLLVSLFYDRSCGFKCKVEHLLQFVEFLECQIRECNRQVSSGLGVIENNIFSMTFIPAYDDNELTSLAPNPCAAIFGHLVILSELASSGLVCTGHHSVLLPGLLAALLDGISIDTEVVITAAESILVKTDGTCSLERNVEQNLDLVIVAILDSLCKCG